MTAFDAMKEQFDRAVAEGYRALDLAVQFRKERDAALAERAPAEQPDGEPVAGTYTELAVVRRLVNEQADDDGLWFVAQTAPEAYLQQELRRLHELIETGRDIRRG